MTPYNAPSTARQDAQRRSSFDDPLVFSRALGVLLWVGLVAVLLSQ